MTNVAIRLLDSSHVSEARRAAAILARESEMNETVAGQLSILVTEVATNTLKHGGGGTVLLGARNRDGLQGIEVLALDKGPGIADIKRVFEDGYSTAGSLGHGLGAVRRLAGMYDLYSAPGLGTAFVVWVPNNSVRLKRQATPDFETSGVCVPIPQEVVCGDSWTTIPRRDGLRVVVADGLGHGPAAADASRMAMEVARANPEAGVVQSLDDIHAALRPTRGAAVAVADIDLRQNVVRFAGVGNIAGSIVSSGPRRQMVSHNGTAGHHARHIQEFTYPWDDRALLILHSDGLSTHWSLDKYPGLAGRDTALVAGILFRDFARGRDDASVVVARQTTAQEVHS